MPTPIDEFNVYKQLRDKAEAQLLAGTTPAAGHWSMGVDALRLLHRLSSNPDKADDALKLLHELQVHQVELDLQNEEVTSNEQVVAEELSLYQTLYDCAPFGYCLVDREGTVVQGNLAAAELFGLGKAPLKGQRIGAFLSPQNRPHLLDLLERVVHRAAGDSCVVTVGDGGRRLKLSASIATGHEHILLACCECETVPNDG